MNRIIYWVHTSVDGFVDGPNGEFDWPVMGPDLSAYSEGLDKEVDTLLFGRPVWQMMVGFWPNAESISDDPHVAAFAPFWRATPKIVFSRTYPGDEWTSRVISTNLAVEVGALKARPGGGDMLLTGGAALGAALTELGLIDEYHIAVHPVVLGSGRRLFAKPEHRHTCDWSTHGRSTARSSCRTTGSLADRACQARGDDVVVATEHICICWSACPPATVTTHTRPLMEETTMANTTMTPGTVRGRLRDPRLALALLSLPSLLIAIDISVLGVALPRMAADLRPSPTELLWMNDIYGFMVGGTMITMGAVGDRIGRRRLIVTCAGIFAVASAVAAFSTGPWMIIVTRAVMGIAGAAIMPASMALIGRLFPDPKRSVSAMGAYMTCFLVGMTIAPLVGGVMIEYWWWGSVFLLGVPVMLLTLVAAPCLLPDFRAPAAGRLDLRSAALCLASILLVVAALKMIVNSGWSWQPVVVAVAGIGLGAVFVRRQHVLDDPLVDLSLLRRPGAARAMCVLFLTALLMGGTSIFWAFYLQSAQGLSPLRAALWLVPSMIAMIAASNFGPWLGRRIEPAQVILGSLLVMTAGFVSYAMLPPGRAGIPAVVCGAVLTTAGIGAAFPFLMNDIISHAPQERAGSAASLAQTANEIGIATGLVVLGSIGTVVYRSQLTSSTGHADGSWVDGFREAGSQHDTTLLQHVQEAFTSGFRAVGIFGVAMMVVVLLLRLARSRPGR